MFAKDRGLQTSIKQSNQGKKKKLGWQSCPTIQFEWWDMIVMLQEDNPWPKPV